MKRLEIIRETIVGIITIVIVLAIFSVASNKFETAVFALLVWIYLSVSEFRALWDLSRIRYEEDIKAIKCLLNKDTLEESVELNTDQERLKAVESKTLITKSYINVGFRIVVFTVVIFYLVHALLN